MSRGSNAGWADTMQGQATQCDVPPSGWWCSRPKGHEGQCAARPELKIAATRRDGFSTTLQGQSRTPRCDELDRLREAFSLRTSAPYNDLLKLARELESAQWKGEPKHKPGTTLQRIIEDGVARDFGFHQIRDEAAAMGFTIDQSVVTHCQLVTRKDMAQDMRHRPTDDIEAVVRQAFDNAFHKAPATMLYDEWRRAFLKGWGACADVLRQRVSPRR